jgi:hypothetical protein
MATPVSGANTWLLLNDKPLSFQEDSENLEAQVRENYNNRIRATRYAPDDLRISIDDELLETDVYGRWYWNPKDYAGLYVLEVSAPGYPLLTAKVRVFPGKLSLERFELMLQDISLTAADLLFSLKSPVREKVAVRSRGDRVSALNDYQILQPIVYTLGKVIAAIRRSPHQTLHEYTEQRLFHEVRQFSSEIMPAPGAMIQLPERVASNVGGHYLPQSWVVRQNRLTYDVYENRLLKHFILYRLLPRIYMIRDRATNELKRREQSRKLKIWNGWEDDEMPKIEVLKEVIEECQKMARWCIAWGGEQFLRGVKSSVLSGDATQVLLKHPFYSQFYRLYLNFQSNLRISLDAEQYLTTLSLRKMSELYEMWAVFQATGMIVDRLLDADYMPVSDKLFYEVEQDKFQFEIRKDVASIVLTKDDLRIEIKYEPLYPKFVPGMSGLVSTDYRQLTPDMAVEIYKKDKVQHVIIFDAKYRYEKEDGIERPKEEDLDKMRKYRDLIRYKAYDPRNPKLKPHRIVSSSYILYPGTVVEHDPDEPEVGALPFIPNMSTNLREKIEGAIDDILCKIEIL